jgi:anti-sigma28 factor (negative regulator of flagellin synthesis)
MAGLSAPAFGQDAVTLKWEFQKDKPFYQEMKTTTKQTMKVTGMEISQTQEQGFTFSWTPKEQDKDKNWIVNQKIEAIKMDIEMGGNKISYDSLKDTSGTGNPLADFFKALVGSEFKLTISPDMKVLKIEGRDEFMQKLAKANPQMEPLLKQILSDDALKQMADPAFAAVPNKPVKKGDSWEKTSKLNMGPIGTYDTTYKYTYDGKDGKLDKIKMTTNLTYQTPGANAAGNLPFKIKDANLKSKNAEGTIWFDNEKHRLEKSDLKLKLEGKLTIDISGNTTDVELTQDQTTTVNTTDTNPIKK